MLLYKNIPCDLITLLMPHINLIRTCCARCYICSKYITAAEIAYLLVLNKQNRYTLAIDLSVYTRNQQFRLFNSVKINKTNSLLQTTTFPFDHDSKNFYDEMLKKSLITYNDLIDVPIVFLKDDHFLCKSTETIYETLSENYSFINFNNINTHSNIYFKYGSHFTSTSNSMKLNIPSEIITRISTNEFEQDMQQFRPFVEKLIQSDNKHQGFIRSCVRGNRNTDVLFFNIGGNYRYCPRKRAHHQQNTTAVLIDMKNRTFGIRCKDQACNNTVLVWNKIE
ncbi:unnamed protein product [Adineta steineri]|uniref:DNA-directed primase/polymerase protein n=1 Tax=Adineta steineri TaxID=433720 RepID=A0A816D0D8_9BILA|nr:unnamed protein product [Adineta steineri]CAF1628435.1 unnamed protein product [Adineta steineri]